MNEEIKITDGSVTTNVASSVTEEEVKKPLNPSEIGVKQSGIDNPEDRALTKEELAEALKQQRRATADIFTQEVTLPSAGYFGGPTKVRIRRMTTAEEKIIYTSHDGNFVTDIVEACVVDPKLDINKVAPADIVYLLYAIRNITFGEKYKQESVCPECGTRQIVEVDITDFGLKTLDPDYVEELLQVVLPDSKHKLKLRLMTEGQIRALDRKITKDILKNNIVDAEGYEFMQRLMALVEEIDGEPCESDVKTEKFLTNLSMRDYNKLRKQSNEAATSFGVDNNVVFICKKCHEAQEVGAILAPEFFRPNE